MGKAGVQPSFEANPYILLDPEDQHLLDHPWYLMIAGTQVYAARRDGKRKVLLHREVTRCPKGKVVDHLNGNGLDNRRENLRVCTQSQNMLREFPGRGLSLSKGKWRVRVGGREYGRYTSKEEAQEVANRARKELLAETSS